MSEIAVKLQDWSVVSAAYAAPETNPRLYLRGTRTTDGKRIDTSAIVKCEGRIVTTHSGSRYRLGRIHPEYRAWLREQRLPYNARQPIRVASAPDLSARRLPVDQQLPACKPIEGLANVMDGWGCCKCRTYNGALWSQCKFCGHERCDGLD